ncbi:MAG TPA: hypothetical protein VNO22_05475 [Planctomycetota bacterium]|jgi:hypothetical protein|nr:hypothetical protein [Planctomycetota bacterium]
MKNVIATLALGFLAACQAAPAEVRRGGVTLPRAWIERAERGPDDGNADLSWTPGEACEALAHALADRDPIEALRFARKGAAWGDGECALLYLSLVESRQASLSQRVLGRLFLEDLAARRALRSRSGRDVRAELHYRLMAAWRTAEPRDPERVRTNLDAFLRSSPPEDLRRSTLVAQAMRETPPQPEPAPGGGDGWAVRRDVEISYRDEESRETLLEVTAWAGGNDRLWQAAGVLAFLVNDRGEPSMRGTALWIRNLSARTVIYSAPEAARVHRELAPGQEELVPLVPGRDATGVALTVRFRTRF